jgi:hypothetical protein
MIAELEESVCVSHRCDVTLGSANHLLSRVASDSIFGQKTKGIDKP